MRLFLLALWWGTALAPAAAQTGRPASHWPRHPDNGRVEFVGTLPWPAAAATSSQRQALTQRWFAAQLTQIPATQYPEAPPTNAPYAGLPPYAYLDSVWYSPGPDPEKFTYRLFFDVVLVPTSAGLTYRLHHFEWAEIGSDFSTSGALEDALPKFDKQLRGYVRRIRHALAGW